MNSYCTIDGFEKLTAQQVFDISAKHLLTQMEKSEGTDKVCRYRGTEGRMCAAGPFLKDESVHDCEGGIWVHLIEYKLVPSSNSELIQHLQWVHDCNGADSWKTLLKSTALRFNLEFKESEYVQQ